MGSSRAHPLKSGRKAVINRELIFASEKEFKGSIAAFDEFMMNKDPQLPGAAKNKANRRQRISGPQKIQEAAKRGRPKLPEEDVKNEIVRARFSRFELSRLVKAAGRRKLSEWVRSQLLSVA